MKLQVLNPPQTINKVALVCIAHADDLLLFIGGSVAALVKAGWQVAVVRATDDRWDSYLLSQEQTILNNKNEFELAMGEIGVSKIFELELPTDLLGDYSEVELRSSFIRIIREFKPYLTITFDPDSYPYEDNQDHKKVAIAMAEANWAAGFDKHPNSGSDQLPPYLPVANWYFGREVAAPTHYFDVSKFFDKATSAAALHKTMLVNMARQLEIKAESSNKKLSITKDVEQLPKKFVSEIMSKNRLNQIKSVKYAEIFRVIDSSKDIDKLIKSRRK